MIWALDLVKAAPWRAGVAVALVLAVVLMGWRVSVWHDSHGRLQATEKALETVTAERDRYAAREASAWQALRESAGKAKAREAADRATAERVEHELQTKLAAADARGRDLARRLSNAARAACPGRSAVPGAAPAAVELAGTAGEPSDPDGVGEALAAHLTACERDAERLGGWQGWWIAVESGHRQRN